MATLNLIDYDLDTIKNIVQSILDKHIPEEKRFSIQDMNQEQIGFLIELLLEKDSTKKEEIQGKISESYNNAIIEQQDIYKQVLIIKNQVDITKELGNSLEELKVNIKNDNDILNIENEVGF